MASSDSNVSMASEKEPSSLSEEANKPGMAMRLSIAMTSKKFPSVKNISTSDLWLLMNETESENPNKLNLVLLDCRQEEEFEISHLEGAININHNHDATRVIERVPQLHTSDSGKLTIVCYCSVGYRSSDFATKLQKVCSKNEDNIPCIYNLEGSLFKWANEGRPMVDINNTDTVYAHPYNSIFGKLLDQKLRKSKL